MGPDELQRLPAFACSGGEAPWCSLFVDKGVWREEGRDRVACGCVFGGMAPASDAGKPMRARRSPGLATQGEERIGAPSAGLSLGRLHACRAHLRFTRHCQAIAAGSLFTRAEIRPRDRVQDGPTGVAKDSHF